MRTTINNLLQKHPMTWPYTKKMSVKIIIKGI